MIKKILLRGVLFLAVLYCIWLAAGILRYPASSGIRLGRQGNEWRGAYHIHSSLSDGKKTVEEIVSEAQRASLDFIILVDHGSPNRETLDAQGRAGDLFVLAGSELSVSRGHLVGLDISDYEGVFPQNAEGAAYAIRAASGFSVIAHPYSRVPWSWGENVGYSGIEIVSAYSAVGKNPVLALPYLPALLIKPRFALLRLLRRPEANLRKWDRLARSAPIYGYFGLDAHLLYRPLLSFLNLHVLFDQSPGDDFFEAGARIFSALRRGRFYNGVDAAAPAGGFRFHGSGKAGRIRMGEELDWEEGMTLHVKAPFDRRSRIELLRNGRIIEETKDRALAFAVRQPGVYRVEVYLEGGTPLPKDVPWIVSNPIFIRK